MIATLGVFSQSKTRNRLKMSRFHFTGTMGGEGRDQRLFDFGTIIAWNAGNFHYICMIH